MNDDIRGTLSRALPDDLPAPRIDLDDVELKGEKLIRRRRIGTAGTVTAAVALVAAVTVAVPMLLGGGTSGAANAGDGEQQEYPIPELDPKYDYMWGTNFEEPYQETAATAELTTALWDHLAREFPDLKVVDEGDPDNGGWDPDDPDFLKPTEYPDITRSMYDIVIPEGAPSVSYRKPAYGTGTIGNRFGDITTHLDTDRRVYDGLAVEVHPKGSYIADAESTPDIGMGPAVPYLLEGCEDGTNEHNDYEYDFTCDETTGPDGRTVKTVKLAIVKDGKVWSIANSVIVVLDNGNAVVVRDAVTPDAIKGDAADITDEQMEPELDFDELVDLALALPEVVVE